LGQIVKAKVTRFEDYGVIVNLGSSPGLILNSDLCEKKIIHPSDMLELKQEIEAKIIRIDSRGIRLSLKEVNEGTHHIHNSSDEQKFVRKKVNKFSLFNKEYKVSDIIEGTIIKIVQSSPTTLKVHIELKYGVYGSFYTFSENQRIKMKSKVLVEITKIDNIKQNVKCKIIA
jgi:ribosomal protein S1